MFKAERDDEFSGHAVVCELSDDYNRDGTVVGYTVGEEALDDAAEVARYMSGTGRQPPQEMRETLNYTVAAGEEF